MKKDLSCSGGGGSGSGGGGGGGGGGGSDVGSGRGIPWYDPLSTESRIFVFCEEAFRTDLTCVA